MRKVKNFYMIKVSYDFLFLKDSDPFWICHRST